LGDVSGRSTCDLQRRLVHLKALDIPPKKLVLKFEQVDTEELKDVEILFNGDRAIFKVGEGETSHYHVPNDKKLWETQFMICSIDGQYFIRDLGFVHASRLKLDTKCEVQIHKGCLVDLGKVVHYHFDKAIHLKEPTQKDSSSFYVLRHKKSYEVDPDDFPHLRARPTWVSAEEHIENIQNEINIYADGQRMINSLGRSMKRDIQIKLKAVSADHCAIAYNPEKGWTISERGKDRASSNGTYVFLKTLKQMRDHMPSDLIPLHDGMIISFVNYELRVRFEDKSADEITAQTKAASLFFNQLDEEMAAKSYPTVAGPAGGAPAAKATPQPSEDPSAPAGGDGYVPEQVQPSAPEAVAVVAPVVEPELIKEPEAAGGEAPVAVKSHAPAPVEEPPVEAPAQAAPAQAEAAPAGEPAKEEEKPKEEPEAVPAAEPEPAKEEQPAAAEEAPAEKAPEEEAKPAAEPVAEAAPEVVDAGAAAPEQVPEAAPEVNAEAASKPPEEVPAAPEQQPPAEAEPAEAKPAEPEAPAEAAKEPEPVAAEAVEPEGEKQPEAVAEAPKEEAPKVEEPPKEEPPQEAEAPKEEAPKQEEVAKPEEAAAGGDDAKVEEAKPEAEQPAAEPQPEVPVAAEEPSQPEAAGAPAEVKAAAEPPAEAEPAAAAAPVEAEAPKEAEPAAKEEPEAAKPEEAGKPAEEAAQPEAAAAE